MGTTTKQNLLIWYKYAQIFPYFFFAYPNQLDKDYGWRFQAEYPTWNSVQFIITAGFLMDF